MNWEEIIIYIVALLPSLASVIAVVTAVLKVLAAFKELQDAVHQKVEMEELRDKLDTCLAETEELKKILKKDIQTRTHIKD